MAFVFDSDILSTFAKIGKLNILKKISRDDELLIPPAVVLELKSSKFILLHDILNIKIPLMYHKWFMCSSILHGI